MKHFAPNNSFLRVATATPIVHIGDVYKNYQQINSLYDQAVKKHVGLLVFPELSLTGYSLGDVVRQRQLLDKALDSLTMLATSTKNKTTAMIVGLPYEHKNKLYNCAALLASGEIKGIVTKTNLPNYCEFYEQRWYQSFHGADTTTINNHTIPFGQGLLFDIDSVLVGVEICEDMWVQYQPSRSLTAAGALVIANPSASPEIVGKANYRKDLVRITSATERCTYIYAGADWTESTTDIVMGGHSIICENGSVLAERRPFAKDDRLMACDIDIDHLRHDRLQDTTVLPNSQEPIIIQTGIKRLQKDIIRTYPKSYFLPEKESDEQKATRLSSIFDIQAHGLARRILASHSKHIVLGLSGGLDSTLALLVSLRTCEILDKQPHEYIHAITMPGPASSSRTQTNSLVLAKATGVFSKTITINNLVDGQLAALKHDQAQDVTYENIQARTRTNILFNYANAINGLVLGTGDLSELALGWCTFGGDHLSSYNVNASIPKTLVKELVSFVATIPEFAKAQTVLKSILDTPISPELTAQKKDIISQTTEEIIGPYQLHDFFLYHVLRFGDSPQKIRNIAYTVFHDNYDASTIDKYLKLFYKRFTANQFKRSVMPDGPKVGSVAVSPRGDWRMPSDMSDELWNDHGV